MSQLFHFILIEFIIMIIFINLNDWTNASSIEIHNDKIFIHTEQLPMKLLHNKWINRYKRMNRNITGAITIVNSNGNDDDYQENKIRQQKQKLKQEWKSKQYENNTNTMKYSHLMNHNIANIEQYRHKCRTWIPNEALEKYPWAITIQLDKSKKLQLIEICCAGFETFRWRGNTICRPICHNCLNGICIKPGKCQCYDEFIQNDNGNCVFTCPLGCLNGQCYLDGTCQCNPGFKLDEARKFCRPICSTACNNNILHNCTAPDVCSCVKGYTLTDNDCQPICQPECGIGGICISPNLCQCESGYNYKNGVCQADCYQKCDNGICYSRNRCICNPGYTYHERSTQCIPI